MADQAKTEKTDGKTAAKPKASKAPAGAEAKAAKGTRAGSKAAPPAPEGERCRAEKCKQAIRAKGYCRKHYIAWRRGSVGDHHRYKTCSKEGCRKQRAFGGLCEEHAGKGAAAEGAAAS